MKRDHTLRARLQLDKYLKNVRTLVNRSYKRKIISTNVDATNELFEIA